MIIDRRNARGIIARVRKARAELRALINGGVMCDRMKAALLCMDVAELLTADETGSECHEPREILTLRKLAEVLEMFKGVWLDRIERHPDVVQLVTGG